jgi:hypothetical protein
MIWRTPAVQRLAAKLGVEDAFAPELMALHPIQEQRGGVQEFELDEDSAGLQKESPNSCWRI